MKDHNHEHSHEHGHHHGATHAMTFEDCVRFHGHSCPGLVMGFHAANAAMKALGVTRPEDEDLVAICETDACGIDAIQVIAGTTAGKGNLIIHDYGKHAFTFFNRKNGKAVRITMRREESAESRDMADLRKKVFGGTATGQETEQFHTLMQKATADLLSTPPEKVLTVNEISMEAPKKARIFTTVTCECCGEPVADAKTRGLNGKCVCIPCAEGTHPAKKG